MRLASTLGELDDSVVSQRYQSLTSQPIRPYPRCDQLLQGLLGVSFEKAVAIHTGPLEQALLSPQVEALLK